MIRVELVKLVRRPRTWISVVLLCALPFVVAVFIAVTHLAPPPGQGSAFLSAVLQRRRALPGGRAGARAAGVPAGRGRGRGGRLDRGRGHRRHAALPAGPPGRPDPAAGRQAHLGHRVRAAGGGAPVVGHRSLPSTGRRLPVRRRARAGRQAAGAAGGRHVAVRRAAQPAPADRCGSRERSPSSPSRCSAWPRSRCSCPRSPTRPSARRSARWPRWSPARCWSRSTRRPRSSPTCRPGTGWPGSTSSGEPIFWRDIQRGFGIQAVYVVVFLAAAWANFATKDITT